MARERGSGVTPPRVVKLLTKEVSEKSILAVSKATGIGLAAIGRYLKGVGEPTTKTLQKLSDYFNVSVAWLRGDILTTYDHEKREFEYRNLSVHEKSKFIYEIIEKNKVANDISEENFDESLENALNALAKYLLSRKDIRIVAEYFMNVPVSLMRGTIDLLDYFYTMKSKNPEFKLPDKECLRDEIE